MDKLLYINVDTLKRLVSTITDYKQKTERFKYKHLYIENTKT